MSKLHRIIFFYTLTHLNRDKERNFRARHSRKFTRGFELVIKAMTEGKAKIDSARVKNKGRTLTLDFLQEVGVHAV